ncbi:GvpL/GvpF family gas vesicle protein [Streptomyces sp. CRN 30]|uniref:GvpL/GvpF family gas vesicle protein n=1 Tax=Streptomyces sp. CRN 30 TaxID=3075613 RepID=UPI002A801C38|nr:GvpL/GvpF family gas vesicle protein [Streptomyces sp. CRN 30]
MTDRTALYVYALVRYEEGAADGTTGLDGRPLRLLRVPGTEVAALVHEGSPTPFQGDDDRVRRWVGEQNEAVTTVWERTGSLLPMTFNVLVADESPETESHTDGTPVGAADGGTGQSAEERLTRWVGERAAEIGEHLDALSGRCELRVEITVDRTAVVGREPDTGEADARFEGRSAGMRRLLAKRREQQARNAAGQLADVLHAEARRALLSVAEDFRDRGLGRTGPDETGVLSAALLVRNEDIDAVGSVLSALREREPATRIRFLGPWPPYSFTDDRFSAYGEGEGAGETVGAADDEGGARPSA